jgi:catechol 2,3-dioxygenase-like lactoylglutathione lyase family enzyme
MALQRMDNVGIVVDDLAATVEFFRELGLELEGQATIEGDWAERVTGLRDMRVEIAMMRTPDGHSRLELSRFITPPAVADHRNAPVNALGYLRVMFAVDDIDETLARLRKRGAQLVSSEVVQYEDAYRLCYIRGPEGLLIGLAQELGCSTVSSSASRLRETRRTGGRPKVLAGLKAAQLGPSLHATVEGVWGNREVSAGATRAEKPAIRTSAEPASHPPRGSETA